MGRIRGATAEQRTPKVAAAQGAVDHLTKQLSDLDAEVLFLVGSSSPWGGQYFDALSALKNLNKGNIVDGLLDVAGVVPVFRDGLKGTVKGKRLYDAITSAKDALKVAQSALTRARAFARTRAAAKTDRDAVKAQRAAIMDRFSNCRTDVCHKQRDDELARVNRLPRNGGTWVDANGNPVPARSGYWRPDAGTALHSALSRHQQLAQRAPFEDGRPDFSGFPPQGFDRVLQVEIEMVGGPADIRTAQRAFVEQGGPDTGQLRGIGTWHHDPDGVRMSYVGQRIHTPPTATVRDRTFFLARFQKLSEICWFEDLFSPQEIQMQKGIISESIYADAGSVIMPPGFYAIGSAYGKTDRMRLMVNLEAASNEYDRIFVWYLAHDPLGSGDNTRGLAYLAPDLATFFANLQTEDVL